MAHCFKNQIKINHKIIIEKLKIKKKKESNNRHFIYNCINMLRLFNFICLVCRQKKIEKAILRLHKMVMLGGFCPKKKKKDLIKYVASHSARDKTEVCKSYKTKKICFLENLASNFFHF